MSSEITLEVMKQRVLDYCHSRGCRGEYAFPQDCPMFDLKVPCVEYDTTSEDLIRLEYKTLFGRDPEVKSPADICAGDLVIIKNISRIGAIFVGTVLPTVDWQLCAISPSAERSFRIEQFGNDFRLSLSANSCADIWEIQKVYGPAPACRSFENSVEGRDLLYAKEVKRKMTVKEISYELGYEVEVIT